MALRGGESSVNIAKKIRELRESVGENRTEFSKHTGIPVRTIEGNAQPLILSFPIEAFVL